jgi:N-acetylmuramoyl-L-alanine amidase
MPGSNLSRRGFLGLLAGLIGVTPGWADVTGATLAGTDARTRLMLRLQPGAAWRLTAATKPRRLLLHLPGTTWQATRRLRGAGRVASATYDSGDEQLVLALEGPVAVRRATMNGGYLVVEFVPSSTRAFDQLAAAGRVLAQSSSGSLLGRTSSNTAQAARPATRLPLVVLDPGHGGRDPGAIGRRGTQEKRIVLAAAQELKRLLEAGGRCRVAMTRTRDVFVPLGDRVEFARKQGAALFLSLHADSAPGARGASVYTLNETASDALSAALARRENLADQAGGLRLPSVSPEVQRILISLMRQETRTGSARIARLAVAELGQRVPLLPNTHRQASFVVLKAPEVPSALVEMGFLSHPQDEAALRQRKHRAKLAAALRDAVHGWIDARGDHLAAIGTRDG